VNKPKLLSRSAPHVDFQWVTTTQKRLPCACSEILVGLKRKKARHRPCRQSFKGWIRRQISVNIGKLQGGHTPFEADFDYDDDDEQVGENSPAFAKNRDAPIKCTKFILY
jgi:hypothetical protein